jgi:hypothetical protein
VNGESALSPSAQTLSLPKAIHLQDSLKIFNKRLMPLFGEVMTSKNQAPGMILRHLLTGAIAELIPLLGFELC